MNKQELVKHLENFSQIRSIFHSEADFQLEFGMYLGHQGYKIRLEKSFKGINIYPRIELDMEINGEIAIEMKYKTSAIKINSDSEIFDLKQHGASNLGRFDAIDDARRVKELVNSAKTRINKGFTIFLTNDSDYWLNDASRTMS
jgi:hypothetical protein